MTSRRDQTLQKPLLTRTDTGEQQSAKHLSTGQTDRQTPLASDHQCVDIQTAGKKLKSWLERTSIRLVTTTKTVSYSLHENLDVLLFHHLNTTVEQLTEPSLKKTQRVSLKKRESQGVEQISEDNQLTSGCPKGLCCQPRLGPCWMLSLFRLRSGEPFRVAKAIRRHLKVGIDTF